MKFDAECNETTHEIILYRFDEEYEILTKMMSESWSSTTQIVELEKKKGQIWNQRPLKRTGPLWPLLFRFFVCQKIDDRDCSQRLSENAENKIH